MPQPENITRALPAGGSPASITEAMPIGNPRAQNAYDSLPGASAAAQGTLDALPDQPGNHHPINILRALPVTIAPPFTARVFNPTLDVLAQFGWDGWNGAQVFPPNIYTTFDEGFPPNENDYARNSFANGAGIYQWSVTINAGGPYTVVANAATDIRFATKRTGTSGVYNLFVQVANLNAPGVTWFARTLTDAQLRAGGAAFTLWDLDLTAGEIAAIDTTSQYIASFSFGGGPAGGDPGELQVSAWQMRLQTV